MTLVRADGLEEEAGGTVSMSEDQFLLLYHRTARPLRAYLLRMSRDPALADDLLQEAYLRMLRADLPVQMPEEHQRNYLYRIATNLLRDHLRKPRAEPLDTAAPPAVEAGMPDEIARMLAFLEPREREMMWLAYVERFSHEEIGHAVGANPRSVRTMLYRARHKLAAILRRKGWNPKTSS